MPNTWLKHLLAVEKNIYAQAKVIKSLHDKLKPEWLFIHITLETAPNEMQCDETISHMVTASWSYFRTLQSACVTAGKTTMTACKIYHGCFEMLSWTHRASANIINMFLVARDLYEMFVFYRGNHTTRHSTVGIWSEVRVYRRPATNIPWAGGLYLGKFPDNRCLRC